MTRDSQTGVHIPDAVLCDREPEETAAAEAALYFSQAVKELQDAKLYPIAAGMMIWLHTYRAYLHPECRYLGRAVWKELSFAFDEASRAIPDAFHGDPDRIATLLELLVVPAGMEPVDETRNV